MWYMEDKKSLNLGRFTCRQNHSSSFIEWRLDFFHISNILQEFVKNTDVLAFFGADHSPNVFSLELKDMILCGKGFWKFNSSLISNTKYTENMQNHIFETAYTWPSNWRIFNPFSTDVSLMQKPGSWFLLAKCFKNTCGRVTF